MPDTLAGSLIVFDLDGTLVDTAPDLHRILNQVLADESLPPVPLQSVRNYIGEGVRALIARGAGHHQTRFSDQRLDVLTQQFISLYSADIAHLSRPFDAVESTLDQLQNLGATFCVCTNKRTALAVLLLETLGMASRFRAIVGADSVQNRKPHPQHFLDAVSKAQGRVEKSMMVGDSEADSQAAKGAGAPVVLVNFGYTQTAPEKLAPDAVISHFRELPHWALRLLNGR